VLLEEGEDGFDHAHRAAGVDFVFLELGEVFEDGFVDQAGAAGPGGFGLGLGEHRDEVEVVVFLRPAGRQFGQVEVFQGPDAPVEVDLALEAALEGVFDHALDRREAGGAGDEDDRALGFKTIGRSDSRRLKSPIGPSKRTSSPSFIFSKTCVVNLPPVIRRICSSTNSGSCGGLAKEKARRWPSSRMMFTYWPALKAIVWPSGSLSRTRITSWVSFSILTTRAVYSGMRLLAALAWYSMITSSSAVAQQESTLPCASSASESALGWYRPGSTLPCRTVHLQTPQPPLRHS